MKFDMSSASVSAESLKPVLLSAKSPMANNKNTGINGIMNYVRFAEDLTEIIVLQKNKYLILSF